MRPNGHVVIIVVSEPWGLAADAPRDNLRGSVVASQGFADGVEEEAMAVKVDQPLEWQSRFHPWLILTPRRGHGLCEALSSTTDVECNFYAVPDESLPGPDDLMRYVEHWRGGLAGIASVRLDA